MPQPSSRAALVAGGAVGKDRDDDKDDDNDDDKDDDEEAPLVIEIVRSSRLRAAPEEVWARVTTAEGIADEFRPLASMRFPGGNEGASLADLTVGEPAGRAWILLGGLIPVEYDDLVVEEVREPHFFRERSRLGSCRVWEHRRELEALPEGRTRLTDTLRAEPRALVPPSVVRVMVGALFDHRHRRLARAFGAETGEL